MRYLFLLFVILFPLSALGQEANKDIYGSALWFRSDVVPQDGIVGSWILDGGVGGDVFQGVGSMEGTWQGASGGCDDCPQSATCVCVGGTSNISKELAYVYDYDTSVKVDSDPGGAGVYFSFQNTFEASTCYQVTFHYRGETGVEDIELIINDAGWTDYYNFSTDTWGAYSSYAIVNMPTTWSSKTLYVKTGLVAKTNYRVLVTRTTAGQTYYIDGIKLEKLNNCSPQDRLGVNDPQVPVTSDPNFGSSQNMSYRVGTGPAYKTGGTFNGTTDYLRIADTAYLEPSNFPEKSASFGCRVVPETTASAGDLFTKYNSGANQKSYLLNHGGSGVGSTYFTVSSDGIASSGSVFVASSMFPNVMTNALASYKFVTNGTSITNLYSNYPGIAVSTSTTAGGPIFNGTENIYFGTRGNLSSWYDGQILSCDMYKRDLSAIEANKWINPYFPSNNNGQGFYVNTCSQAAPEANCSYEKCRAGTPHGCQATGNGVMPTFNQYTELPLNNFFSLFAGDISNPTITNWAKTVTGSGGITLYAGDSYYGSYSVRLKGGSADSSMITSDCINTTASYYMYTSAFSKNLLERKQGRIRLRVYRYSDNACANATTSVDSSDYYPDGGAAWSFMGFQNQEAASEAIKVAVIADGNAVGSYDYLVDMVGNTEWAAIGNAIYWPVVPTTNATVTVNRKNYRLQNPLANWVDSRSAYAWAGGECIGFWLWTDWPGNDSITHYITQFVSTGGSNNSIYINKSGASLASFVIFDNMGNDLQKNLSLTGVNWTANNFKYIEACSSNTGTIAARHYNLSNSTWYNWTGNVGAGTGIQNGAGASVVIGDNSAGGANSNAWFFNFVVGPYSAAFPQYGFNPKPTIGRPY